MNLILSFIFFRCLSVLRQGMRSPAAESVSDETYDWSVSTCAAKPDCNQLDLTQIAQEWKGHHHHAPLFNRRFPGERGGRSRLLQTHLENDEPGLAGYFPPLVPAETSFRGQVTQVLCGPDAPFPSPSGDEALKELAQSTDPNQWPGLILSSCNTGLVTDGRQYQ